MLGWVDEVANPFEDLQVNNVADRFDLDDISINDLLDFDTIGSGFNEAENVGFSYGDQPYGSRQHKPDTQFGTGSSLGQGQSGAGSAWGQSQSGSSWAQYQSGTESSWDQGNYWDNQNQGGQVTAGQPFEQPPDTQAPSPGSRSSSSGYTSSSPSLSPGGSTDSGIKSTRRPRGPKQLNMNELTKLRELEEKKNKRLKSRRQGMQTELDSLINEYSVRAGVKF